MAGIIFLIMIVLFIIGVPIAASIGVAATAFLGFFTNLPMVSVPQRLFVGVDSFPLMAIPFFVLSGELMVAGGISQRLVRMTDAYVGHLTGGLGAVVIIASMFFAAVSGSSAATVSAVGSIMIPAMIAKEYDKSYTTAIHACSGQMGTIIPPSIPMVLYGVATETSVGDLFKAGILPGLFMGSTLLIFNYFICKKRNFQGESVKATAQEKWLALKDASWAIAMPLIILGGIYSGFFTPTEAAAIAVGYSFFIGIFVYRELSLKRLFNALYESAITTAVILFLCATAALLAWLMGRLNIPQQVAQFITSFTQNKIMFLIIVNIFLIIVGMFFDAAPAIIILAPLLAPIAKGFEMDLVHLGLIMVVNLSVGFCTPPVGINLFVSCKIAGVKLEDIMPDVLKFLVILIFNIIIVSFVPSLSLALIK